ncbi:MAG: ATP-binding cassette domain-containing protein [Faecousia sp.]
MVLPAFSKTYDGVTVLDFPGIELQPGEIYAVIGANGSGKSTFAKILAGILSADRKASLPSRISVGYLPQKPYAFRMNTKKNILLGGTDKSRADELMKGLQLCHLEKKRADRLSGGETARMALARLMMRQFDLLILDEPTAAMDMETTSAAEALIQDYVKETGCALILVTHSLQQARRVADAALFFRKGKLVESGEKAQVLYDPTQPETKRFLEFYGQ